MYLWFRLVMTTWFEWVRISWHFLFYVCTNWTSFSQPSKFLLTMSMCLWPQLYTPPLMPTFSRMIKCPSVLILLKYFPKHGFTVLQWHQQPLDVGTKAVLCDAVMSIWTEISDFFRHHLESRMQFGMENRMSPIISQLASVLWYPLFSFPWLDFKTGFIVSTF